MPEEITYYCAWCAKPAYRDPDRKYSSRICSYHLRLLYEGTNMSYNTGSSNTNARTRTANKTERHAVYLASIA